MYPNFTKKKKSGTSWSPLLSAAFFLLFVYCLQTSWPEGVQVLRQLVWSEETAAAFSTLTEQLKTGEAPLDAVSAFCQDVFHGK